MVLVLRTNERESIWIYMTTLNLPKNWVFTKGSGTLMHGLELIKKKIHPQQRKLSRLRTVKKRCSLLLMQKIFTQLHINFQILFLCWKRRILFMLRIGNNLYIFLNFNIILINTCDITIIKKIILNTEKSSILVVII